MPPMAALSKPAPLGRGIADVAALTSRVKAVALVAPRPVAVAVQGEREGGRRRARGLGRAVGIAPRATIYAQARIAAT